MIFSPRLGMLCCWEKSVSKMASKRPTQENWKWEESVSEKESGEDGSGSRVLPFLIR